MGLRDTIEEADASWKDQHGALVGTREGDPDVVAPAIALALMDLGYRRHEGGGAPVVVSIQHFRCARGAWALASLERGTARALAARLASRSGETALVLAARATYRENVKPACLFEASDATVSPDGRFGAAEPLVADRVRFGDDELETDHPWRLVERTLDEGIRRWVGQHANGPRSEWTAPTALPNVRLDGLARQIRAGAEVERVLVKNRPALRVKAIDGTVSTAFLSDDELEALAAALPGHPIGSRG